MKENWTTYSKRKRLGPRQAQINLYLDKDTLAKFDALVGPGNRSTILRQLIGGYVKAMVMREELEKVK